MVGYPEALTDPSYKSQVLTLTYPLVGNYGVPPYDLNLGLPLYFESDRIQVQGLVIHELCHNPYHWASTRTLDKWLSDEGIPGIYGVDNRHLTKKLRAHGVMLGILKVCEAGEEPNLDKLLTEAKNIPDPNLTDLARQVSVKKPIHYKVDGKHTVVLIDCGVKYNIIRNLLKRGISAYVPIAHDHVVAHISGLDPCDWNIYRPTDIEFLRRAHELWILATNGWNKSKGVNDEAIVAESLNIRIKLVTILGGCIDIIPRGDWNRFRREAQIVYDPCKEPGYQNSLRRFVEAFTA